MNVRARGPSGDKYFSFHAFPIVFPRNRIRHNAYVLFSLPPSFSLFLFFCLPVSLPSLFSVYLSLYHFPFSAFSLSLSICLSITLYLSFPLHILLLLYLSIYLSVCPSTYLSFYYLLCFTLCLSLFLSFTISISQFLSLSSSAGFSQSLSFSHTREFWCLFCFSSSNIRITFWSRDFTFLLAEFLNVRVTRAFDVCMNTEIFHAWDCG